MSVQVELVEGRGERCWPRPGRIFAAATVHSFAQLAAAIDDAFARWDRSHLHEFTLGDGTHIGIVDPELDDDDSMLDEQKLSLARLNPGEQFVYVFDFGDDWA
ncbi:MAG: plasmid pRiA4b ORF-3 family protein, partial [Chloroflexi bacterium]